MKTCSNCGQELNDDVKFCIACGAPVDGEDTEAEEAMVESYDEEDDREWYESDIFNAAISPLVASFDNGKFFLFTAKAVIDALVSIFLFSQPYLAYQIYKNDGLVNSTATEKTWP